MQEPKYEFYNEDCISGAERHIADNSVDLLICDPPYGIKGESLDKHYYRDKSYVLGGYVDVDQNEYESFSRNWITQAERVLKPGGSIYLVSGYTNLVHVLNSLRETSLREVNHIIWKYNFGVYTTKKFVSSHYHILFYDKPGDKRTFNTNVRYGNAEVSENSRSLNYADREDVWHIDRKYSPGKTKNQNVLPRELLEKMIQYSSNIGDTVGDFFLGSFSTAKVAKGLGRGAVGFEISKTAFDHQMSEMDKISVGEMLKNCRIPEANLYPNRGKSLSVKEREKIRQEFMALLGSGATRKAAQSELSNRFGRGPWSITRIVAGI